MAMIREKQELFGIKPVCMAVGIARASYGYRVRSCILACPDESLS